MNKIIYIANVRMPTEKAHGIQIMKMCEAFANQGLEVELIMPWRFNKIKQCPFEYYGIKCNFKIKRMPSLDLIFLNIPKIGFWIQSLTFSISVFFYLLFFAKGGSASGGKKADVIYSRDSFILFWLSFFKKNLVYEMHILSKYLFWRKKFSKIVVITQKIEEFLIKKGINKNKILVASDGVDLERFNINILKEEARKKLNLPQDKKIVLYTGHLYEWKGVQILTDVAKFLDRDTLVVFVGGTKKDEKKFKEKNKNLDSILILGHKPYSDIPYYLKSADVLILPNLSKEKVSKYWTSPMKMFEYMASKKPIVASGLPCLREILNEENAILVKPDNPKALAKGIKNALNNDNVSQKAFEDVQKYTWDKRVKKILKFINE